MARRAGGAGAGWVLVDSQFDRRLAVATNPGGIHAIACTDRDGDCDACPGADVPAPVPTTVAQEASHSTFQSPSGNINCMMYASGGEIGARCEVVDHTWAAPPRSPDCPLNWGDRFYLTQGGDAGFGCYHQEFPTAERTLGYGQTQSVGTLTCDSESTGMTCTDSSTGHYFRVSREIYELG